MLRQEAGRKRVGDTPTNDMMANGLTKVLLYEAHQRFVPCIGLIDIKERVEECRLQDITLDNLEQLKDSISGVVQYPLLAAGNYSVMMDIGRQ